MPAIDWSKLTPEQAKVWSAGIMRDAKHVGISPEDALALCFPVGIDPGKPGSDMTVIWPQQATKGNTGAAAAERVAYWVREELERRYPDSVNARCAAMAGENHMIGVLAVTWMRGREVFHRRFPIDAHYVLQGSSHQFAHILLPTIIRQIDATEGAERP